MIALKIQFDYKRNSDTIITGYEGLATLIKISILCSSTPLHQSAMLTPYYPSISAYSASSTTDAKPSDQWRNFV